jgi:transposase InsO family protein
VIDEHSRLCLTIRVGRRCKAKDVVAVLEELTSLYPAPAFIRSDNGPEYISQALRAKCKASGTTTTAFIKPGSPWENGFAESFNGRFRDEFLNTELLATAPEAQILADRWRWEYNTIRPHSALQGAYAPGGSSTGSCRMTMTTHSHKAWIENGGQVIAPGGSSDRNCWAWGRRPMSGSA